ncbi:MAG: hypothetical protein RIR00_200 [Pseudomonadota bacterium]|jgi:lipoprotein NlpD
MKKDTLLLASSLLLLAACASQPPAPVVERGSATPAAAAAQPPVAVAVATPVLTGNEKGYYAVKKGDTLYRIALDNGQDYRDIAAWNNLTNPNSIQAGQVLRVVPPGSDAEAGAVVSRPISAGGVVETRPLDSKPLAGSDTLKREPRAGKEAYSDEAYARLQKQTGPVEIAVAKPGDAKPAEVKVEPAVAVSGEEVAWGWPAAGKVQAGFNDASNKGLDLTGKAGDPVNAAGDGKVVYAGTGLRGYGQLVIVKHNATFLSAYAHNQKILVKEGQAVSKGQKIAEMGSTDSDNGVKLHFEIRRQGKPVDPMSYLPKR